LRKLLRKKCERGAVVRARIASCVLMVTAAIGCGRPPPAVAPTTYQKARSPSPLLVVGIAASVTSTCSLTAAGAVACWGGGGPERPGAFLRPTPIPAATGARSLHGGIREICAILIEGGTHCWDARGVATAGPISAEPPVQLIDTVKGWCTLLGDGSLRCPDGQARGEGALARTILSRGARKAAGTLTHACAIGEGGTVSCWLHSAPWAGMLGPGPSRGLGPAQVPGIRDAIDLAVSMGRFTCASEGDGDVACWGVASAGERMAITGVREPVKLAATGDTGCALQRDGVVVCWPFPYVEAKSVGATAVPGLANVVDIAAGGLHACALRATGEIDCWGDNTHGQLGNGTRDAVDGLSRVEAGAAEAP
jgi:hypothetical protein